MCEFLSAIFSLNFENFEKILFDHSVVPKMEWEKLPRSLILENDVFMDTLIYIQKQLQISLEPTTECPVTRTKLCDIILSLCDFIAYVVISNSQKMKRR